MAGLGLDVCRSLMDRCRGRRCRLTDLFEHRFGVFRRDKLFVFRVHATSGSEVDAFPIEIVLVNRFQQAQIIASYAVNGLLLHADARDDLRTLIIAVGRKQPINACRVVVRRRDVSDHVAREPPDCLLCHRPLFIESDVPNGKLQNLLA